ncbi:ABC transporter substrate-binding protein [Kineosporia sp. R_H_3]|uniref:ABC transporter substrate-binding protein n=1 Tax=Kineosporia sp. R_H_3 TaxID=1961848 RepID=UPI000B4B6611|nr:ABC transporter substrate-binding protein [Kineosporia sp. R_H_3]
MRHGSSRVLSSTVALASVVLVAGCATTGSAPTATSSGAGAASTTTVRTTIVVPAGFDPAKGASLPDFLLARMAFDTLVRKDTGGIVGGLATTWTSTPTSATFTLRTDATCTDGTKITPTIVKASLEHLADPKTTASSAVSVFGPGNAPKVTADDAANTVTVTVERPWDLVGGLTIATAGIVCPAGLADPEALEAGTVKGAGSGPYTLTAQQSGASYTFELRTDYTAWPKRSQEPAGAVPKTVQLVVSLDPTAATNLVKNGQLDIAQINAESIPRVEGDGSAKSKVFPFSDYYLVFNERPGSPFADPAVRKAVAQAIDHAAFEKVTSKGTGEVLSYLATKNTPCWDSDSSFVIPTDLAAAKKVLAGKTFRLLGPQIIGTNGAGNVYLQEVLRSAGATVQLENTDVGTWVSKAFGAPDAWDVQVFADLNFIGSLASPLPFFSGPAVEAGGGNLGAVKNAAADAAFAQGLAATDEQGRCSGLRAAHQALVKAADTVPLVNDAFIYAVRPGFDVSMLGGALDDPTFRITGASS